MACAVVAMRGVFTLSEVFHTRDLSFFYWPHHLWLRSNLLQGRFPMWDPYVGFGQSAIADPIRQMLFPPAALLRLLPAVLGFNLLVALPVWVAALGAFFFLRPHASAAGASLGATIFALSGPVLSTANSPNMEWSLAFAPAALAATHALAVAPSVRRVSLLALLFALQALAGEMVMLLGTMALAVSFGALLGVPRPTRWRGRARVVLLVAAASMLGLMLAAPQLLPLSRAAHLSGRATKVLPDVLSLHPLALVETVASQVLGDWSEPWAINDPWTQGLYGLYTSIYVGAAALALGLAGALSPDRLRWRVFWCVIALTSLLLALGRFTPIHNALMEVFPPARSLRYPAKYAIFAVLAVAALAATGWDALGARGRRHVAVAMGFLLVVAAAALLAFGAVAFSPEAALAALTSLSKVVGLPDPAAGGSYLMRSLRSGMPRTAALPALGAACLWAAPRRPRARWALFTLVIADLLAANSRLNPTVDARLLGEPPWAAATRAHPGDRVYLGGRLSWSFDLSDVDDPGRGATPPPNAPRAVVSSVFAAAFATFPSAWAVREATSADLSFLWPLEYTLMMRDLVNSDRAGRTRFLRRGGVRYFLMPRPPEPEARVVLRLPGFSETRLFEIDTPAPRASVVSGYAIVPETSSQVRLLFDERFDPRRQVLLTAEPGPPAGAAGPGREPRAQIERDGIDEVTVKVDVPEGGSFHLLLDSYDRGWEVEVDGRPAAVMRADGLFRAVRVASGEHALRWVYRAPALRTGVAVAAAALAVLGAGLFFEARARRA